MPVGIHNRFKKPKPTIKSVFDKDPTDTENEATPPPSITLDGDSFALRFHSTTMEIIRERLYDLLHDVERSHRLFLYENGIVLGSKRATTYHLKSMLSLETTKGYISVHSTDTEEATVFRRVANVLARLPILDILKKHNVQLIRRR